MAGPGGQEHKRRKNQDGAAADEKVILGWKAESRDREFEQSAVE
jgi:hypothetical protein